MFALYPGVHDIQQLKGYNNTIQFRLVRVANRYKTPELIFGRLRERYQHLSLSLKNHDFTTSVLLLGQAGAGKTEICKLLSNFAIDNGLIVINMTNIKYSQELIKFLESLDNVVLFFDEFGKNFQHHDQEKLLTFLVNQYGRRRTVFITDNNKNVISNHIIGRPGRARYSLTFKKIDLLAIKEFCQYNGIEESFYIDILDSYSKVMKFTFDHLQAIVTEKKMFPKMKYREIIGYLNLDFLSGGDILIPLSFEIDKDSKYSGREVIKVESLNALQLELFEAGAIFNTKITLKPLEGENESNPAEQTPTTPTSGNKFLGGFSTPTTFHSGNAFSCNCRNNDIISYVENKIVFKTLHGKLTCMFKEKE